MSEMKKINVPLSDVQEVFELLEKIQSLFHQPMYFRDKKTVEEFAKQNYKQIKRLYYDVVWEWLPDEEKKRYEDR